MLRSFLVAAPPKHRRFGENEKRLHVILALRRWRTAFGSNHHLIMFRRVRAFYSTEERGKGVH